VVGSGADLSTSSSSTSVFSTYIPQAQTFLQRQIDAPDRQIDRLVYELYGLTEEEIRIIKKT
jgi:hypothetical protein